MYGDQDYFGNVLATLQSTNGQLYLYWSPARKSGYGPVGNTLLPLLNTNVILSYASVYQGQRLDPTGFYWRGARYYAPTAGRFLSPDPAGFAGSTWDLYSYVDNGPINKVDADGRFGKGIA